MSNFVRRTCRLKASILCSRKTTHQMFPNYDQLKNFGPRAKEHTLTFTKTEKPARFKYQRGKISKAIARESRKLLMSGLHRKVRLVAEEGVRQILPRKTWTVWLLATIFRRVFKNSLTTSNSTSHRLQPRIRADTFCLRTYINTYTRRNWVMIIAWRVWLYRQADKVINDWL